MKKIKVLPSLIMLAFCFLTLCTGVYCASIINVSIIGDVSIIPADLSTSASIRLKANSLVNATMTVNNIVVSQQSSVTNANMQLGKVDEEQNIVNIELTIKNLSTAPVGMFFTSVNTLITSSTPAAESDILLTETISQGSDTLATLYFTSYTPVASQETGIMKIKIYLTGIDNSSVLENLAYNLQVENYVSTENYQTATGFVKVPYNDISTITSSTFTQKYDITILALPNTVTTIEDGTTSSSAFGSDQSLKGVNLQWVAKLGAYAFNYCTNLVSATLNQELTELPEGVFRYTYSLETIDIPKTIVNIGDGAFAAGQLRELDLSGYNKLVSIGDSAFNVCEFKTVSFNGCTSLTTIGAYAFDSCDMVSIDFTGCTSLKTIGAMAFTWCKYLESIRIVSTVTTIEDAAFEECIALNTVIIDSATIAKKYTTYYGVVNVDCLIEYATYVYVKSGLSAGAYLSNTSNYSKTTISSGTYSGYVLYTKK